MKAQEKACPSAEQFHLEFIKRAQRAKKKEDAELGWAFHKGPKQPLTITLHYPFSPDAGQRAQHTIERTNLAVLVSNRYAAVKSFALDIQGQELDGRMRRLQVKRVWAEGLNADEKTWPKMKRTVEKLIPNKAELFAVWKEFETEIEAKKKLSEAELKRRTSPKVEKKLAAAEKRLAGEEAKSAEKRKDLDARKSAHSGLERLWQSAHERQDAEAAVVLAELVQLATLFLHGLVMIHPEWFREWARKQTVWPVLAEINPEWEKKAREQIKTVQLGEGTIHGCFNKEKAYDKNLPCRRWALAIVETLEKNRRHVEHYTAWRKECETALVIDHELSFVPVPQWALDCANLPPFGKDPATIKQWWAVGKAMVRQECPDFHTRPEWKRYEHTFEGMTPGQIQNRIFDDIRKAMLTIAKDS